jgi:hypothetical protein
MILKKISLIEHIFPIKLVDCSHEVLKRSFLNGRWCMLSEPFPDHGPDEEPDGSPLPAEEPDGPEQCLPGQELPGDDLPEQGLFVCLPAEELTLAGFAEDGRADTMEPGPLLAAVVDTVTGEDAKGLAGLSDDQLAGIISAAQRLESRVAWTRLAALAEFAARRPASADKGIRATGAPAAGPDGISAFAADEIARELHLTWQSAAGELSYAKTVAERLPRTFAALAAGRIHAVHLRIIEDETHVLSAKDAARADEILAETAPGRTFGEVRSAAHRLVLKLDPDAVQRRKDAAKRETQIRPFRERSGNAGMVAREMPSDEVLASWQHIEQRALDLRAAGVPGTLRELRVRAYLDLLQERDSRTAPADPDANGSPARPDGGPSLAAQITITVPVTAMDGDPSAAGEVGGFGLVDSADTRALLAAASRDPRTPRPPPHPPTRDRAEPRRHRRRPRLRGRPALLVSGPASRGLPAHAQPHRHPGHPRPLRPHPARTPLPAQPHPAAPGQRPQRPMYRPRLRAGRRPVRPGSHHPLAPRRTHLPLQHRAFVPAPPPL